MTLLRPRSPDPWRKSVSESSSERRDPRRRPSPGERLLVAVVVAALAILLIWFLFSSAWGNVFPVGPF